MILRKLPVEVMMFWPGMVAALWFGAAVCLVAAGVAVVGALSSVSGGNEEGLRLVANSELLTTGELVMAAGALLSRLMIAALLLDDDFCEACNWCCCCCCWAAAAAVAPTPKKTEKFTKNGLIKPDTNGHQ